MKATKLAIAIAALFLSGEKDTLAAAKRVKGSFKTRAKAQQALIPAFAKKFPGAKFTATKKGVVRWVKGGKATATAKRALNRLLSKAFSKAKAKGKNHRTAPNVDAQAARIVSGHSKAYCNRLIERMRSLLRK